MSAPALRVDLRDPTPPYEQVRRQLLALVADGRLAPGQRLPPLRQLAADLGLAVGTVARAYRELEAAGVVRSRRGGGTRVVDDPPAPDGRPAAAAAPRAAAESLVATARIAGLDLGDALDLVRSAWPGEPSGT